MNYIVFDLEWNQSAAGKDTALDHLPFEIFEIGEKGGLTAVCLLKS